MKKSLIFVILTLIAVMCIFASCGKKNNGECQHQWSSEDIPVSCTENGKRVNTCTLCGLVQESITATATGHNYVQTTITESTCSTPGEQADKCQNCGLVNEGTKNPLPTKNHEYTETLSTIDPTCEDKGKTVKKCAYCDKTRTVESNALGHEWENKEDVIKQVSCTEDGEVIKYKVCKTCEKSTKDQETSEKVEKWGHDLIYNEADPEYKADYLKEIIPATCTDNEKKIYHCLNDGCTEIYERETRNTALGHKCTVPMDKSHEATCVLPKTTYYQCEHAGCTEEKKVEEGSALGHKHTVVMADEEVAATCTNNKIVVKKCERCEDRKNEEVQNSALGHKFTEDLGVTAPATCATNEYKDWGCERCDAVQNRETKDSALNHIYPEGHEKAGQSAVVKDIKVEPKCNADGYTTQKCELCGSTAFSNVDINTNRPAHTRDDSDAGTEVLPTCITDGYYAFKCTVCGENDTEPSGKTKTGVHGNYTKKGTTYAPTCKETGYTEYICTLDDNCTAIDPDSKTRDVVAVIDHTFSGTAEGVISCDACGTEFYDINYAETYVKDENEDDVKDKEVPFEEGSNSLKVTVTLGKVNGEVYALSGETKSVKKEFDSDPDNISVIRIRTGYTDTKFTVKVNGTQVGAVLTDGSYYYIDIVEIDTVTSIEVIAEAGESADIDAVVEIFDTNLDSVA